ncbi:MAG: hypothetical protein R2826_04895 [Thermoleophilia bacterium]
MAASRAFIAWGKAEKKMLTAKRVLVFALGVLGLALIAKGAWGGVWPLSYQLLGGVLLIVYAVVRWRTLG